MHIPYAILFDLDGTLADTAPDLAAAVNTMRTARQLAPLPFSNLRPFASAGARGLLGAAFDITPDHLGYEDMRQEFLHNYRNAIAVHSKLFRHIVELLQELDNLKLPWGIVTNKAESLTLQLLPYLELTHAGCVIGGDTTPHAKPHPAPLLEAANRLAIAPQRCWYVGDDLRDIQAGKAANMHTIAAAWGYCGATAPTRWDADVIVDTPLELLALISASVQQAKRA